MPKGSRVSFSGLTGSRTSSTTILPIRADIYLLLTGLLRHIARLEYIAAQRMEPPT